jgi:hypothetical protein
MCNFYIKIIEALVQYALINCLRAQFYINPDKDLSHHIPKRRRKERVQEFDEKLREKLCIGRRDDEKPCSQLTICSKRTPALIHRPEYISYLFAAVALSSAIRTFLEGVQTQRMPVGTLVRLPLRTTRL